MWLYLGKPICEESLGDFIGFVYIITNLDSGRQYIGKKLFKFKRTKTVKGKKKKILVDSDWKTYWGSNKVLIEEVQSLGQDKYKREIVRLCKSKGELNYFEAKYQFTMGALESERFYNEWIACKIHKVHLKKVDFSST
jgi:hypothetical protein